MAITKTVSIPESLYEQWKLFHESHQDMTFNRFCNLAMIRFMEDQPCVTAAPTWTTR